MPPRFVGEAKEAEKYKGAEHQRPTAEFKIDDRNVTGSPEHSREGVNGIPIEVDIRPALPGIYRSRSNVEIEPVSRNRNVENELGCCETHEAEISVHSERCV